MSQWTKCLNELSTTLNFKLIGLCGAVTSATAVLFPLDLFLRISQTAKENQHSCCLFAKQQLKGIKIIKRLNN